MLTNRIYIILSLLLVSFWSIGCSVDDEVLPKQKEKIVNYLESAHNPRLISEEELSASLDDDPPFYTTAGNTVYRYIDNYYEAGRDSRAVVGYGDQVTITFSMYLFNFANITARDIPFFSNMPPRKTTCVLKPTSQPVKDGDVESVEGVKCYIFAKDTTGWRVDSYKDASSGILTSKVDSKEKYGTLLAKMTPYGVVENTPDSKDWLSAEVGGSFIFVLVVDTNTKSYGYRKLNLTNSSGQLESVDMSIVFRPWREESYYVERDWRMFNSAPDAESGVEPEVEPTRDPDPLKVTLGQTKLIEGLELALLGCREGDVVEAYMTYTMAYGDDPMYAVPKESPISILFTVDKIE